METVWWWIEGPTLILSLLLTALLSSAEVAFLSFSRASLERMRDDGIKDAARMLKIYRPRHELRLMVAVGKSIAAVVATTSMVVLALELCVNYEVSRIYGIVGAIILIVPMLLIFDSTPARLRGDEMGGNSPPRFRLSFYILLLLSPLTSVLNRFLRLFGGEVNSKAAEEELRSIVESESEEGVIEEDEKEMIQGVFGFYDTTVKEVMVPRIDMICAEQSVGLKELLSLIKEEGHSRIPIYEEKIDNIRGIVHAKDLLHMLGTEAQWNINEVMREPHYVPENKKIDDLLREFKNEKIHMAIVVDEYGGTAGLVTLEDLLEEIVGEIRDEYDEEEQPLFRWENDGSLVADAKIDIHDLNEMLEVGIPAEGFETLGGFIYDRLGRIPNEGEEFEFEGLRISIEVVEGQRISWVRIVKGQPKNQSEKEESAV